jgi:arylsulfatase A-like enzyme
MLTGRHGFHTGVAGTLGGSDPGIDPGELLLPTALASTGYARALIGKWHLGSRFGIQTPNVLGWPHFAGGMDGGIADYYQWPKVRNGVASTCTRYATTDQVDDALQWIAARTTPWLLVLSFHAPHQPFHAPPAHLHTQNLAGLDPAANPRPFHRAMVQAMDREVGRLLAGLGAARDNTNVVFLGDNGTDGLVAPPGCGPDRAKGSLYNAGTNVPLIVAGPAVVRPGRVCQALVHSIDLFPTLLQLCAAPLPPPTSPRPIDGSSLMPLLRDTATSHRPYIYVEITGTPFGGGYAIKDGNFELLRFLHHVPERQELYNVVADPGETNDLLAGTPSPQALQLKQHFESLLAAIRSDGWVEGFGQGCAGTMGVPRLRAQSMPRIGDYFWVQVVNAPLQAAPFATVAFGDSSDSWSGGPLPREMSDFGMPGCHLLQNWIAAALPGNGGYTKIWIAPIPSLLGFSFFAQAVVGEPGANAAGIIGSSGLRCVIGL